MDMRYVQLEPAAFLTDSEFMQMTMQERGIYITLILLLYCNKGKLFIPPDKDNSQDPDRGAIRGLCGGAWYDDDETEFGIDILMLKFDYKDDFLTHKRVTEELEKSHNFVAAGRKGAEKRWNRGLLGGANRQAIKGVNGNISKTKESKDNIKHNAKTSQKDDVLPMQKRLENGIENQKLALKLCDLFAAKSDSREYTAICNLSTKTEPEQHENILEIARKCIESPTARQPMAVFFSELKRLNIYTIDG